MLDSNVWLLSTAIMNGNWFGLFSFVADIRCVISGLLDILFFINVRILQTFEGKCTGVLPAVSKFNFNVLVNANERGC